MKNLLSDVDKSFGDVTVFKNMDLDVTPNQILCIVGPSGCGKSTILNLIANITQPNSGKIMSSNEKIGYIFQEDRLLPWETVYENIAIVNKKKNHDEIMNVIKSVELDGYENSYPHELSGGMKQRCSLARGFYYKPSLLLMDEPFKSLDYSLKINMIKYLVDLWKQNSNTIIFVTHDIDEAILLGHKIIVLSHKPTIISKIYNNKTKHGERNVKDEDFTRLRNDIIRLLTKQ